MGVPGWTAAGRNSSSPIGQLRNKETLGNQWETMLHIVTPRRAKDGRNPQLFVFHVKTVIINSLHNVLVEMLNICNISTGSYKNNNSANVYIILQRSK